jgi:hypothetical protein
MSPEAKEEFQEIRAEIDALLFSHRDFLMAEPRLLRPLTEARDAAKTKYEAEL